MSDLPDGELGPTPTAQWALVRNRVWAAFDHVCQQTAAKPTEDRDYLNELARTMAKLALDHSEIAKMEDALAEPSRRRAGRRSRRQREVRTFFYGPTSPGKPGVGSLSVATGA